MTARGPHWCTGLIKLPRVCLPWGLPRKDNVGLREPGSSVTGTQRFLALVEMGGRGAHVTQSTVSLCWQHFSWESVINLHHQILCTLEPGGRASWAPLPAGILGTASSRQPGGHHVQGTGAHDLRQWSREQDLSCSSCMSPLTFASAALPFDF